MAMGRAQDLPLCRGIAKPALAGYLAGCLGLHLEEYLEERQPAVSGLYDPPITFLSPPSGLYHPPDVSHNGYAAVVSPTPQHAAPAKLHPTKKVCITKSFESRQL